MSCWRIGQPRSRRSFESLLFGLTVWVFAVAARAGEPSQAVLPNAVEHPATAPKLFSEVAEPSGVTACPAQEARHYGMCETMWESVFGKPDPSRPWQPLRCGTILTEGWCEPWISPPAGDSGAVRQGWINDLQAFFNRNIFGIYDYADATQGHRDEQVGVLVFETPLSRRYMFGVIVPVVDALDGRSGLPSATGFGDVTFENRVMLQETENLSLSANLDVRTPTGDKGVGQDRTTLFPFLAFWTDVGHGFSVRGGGGFDVPLDSKPDRRDATAFVNLAVGQTLTKHDAAPLGDFTYFVSAVLRQNLGRNDNTFVSLTPGFRTHLGHNWFWLTGVEVPVTGAKPFQEALTLVLVKGF